MRTRHIRSKNSTTMIYFAKTFVLSPERETLHQWLRKILKKNTRQQEFTTDIAVDKDIPKVEANEETEQSSL